MKTIIQVWFKPHAEARPGGKFFDLLEIEGMTFEQITDTFHTDDLLRCNFLHTRAGDLGERVVTRRIAGSVRGSAIDRMQATGWRFTEEVQS